MDTTTAFLFPLAVMHAPWFQTVLSTQPVAAPQWGVSFLIALGLLGVLKIHKAFWNWRVRQRGRKPVKS